MKKYSVPQLFIVDLDQNDLIVTSGTNNSSLGIGSEWTDDSEQLARERGGNPIWD